MTGEFLYIALLIEPIVDKQLATIIGDILTSTGSMLLYSSVTLN